jgi:hypothetical protein
LKPVATPPSNTAPLKPSKQTHILLDQMSKSADEEKTNWDQVMENFDLLYARINDMGITQQELKTQIQLNNTKVEQCSKEQKFIAQPVQANGHAVA